jgi:hypothetical protein
MWIAICVGGYKVTQPEAREAAGPAAAQETEPHQMLYVSLDSPMMKEGWTKGIPI